MNDVYDASVFTFFWSGGEKGGNGGEKGGNGGSGGVLFFPFFFPPSACPFSYVEFFSPPSSINICLLCGHHRMGGSTPAYILIERWRPFGVTIPRIPSQSGFIKHPHPLDRIRMSRCSCGRFFPFASSSFIKVHTSIDGAFPQLT